MLPISIYPMWYNVIPPFVPLNPNLCPTYPIITKGFDYSIFRNYIGYVHGNVTKNKMGFCNQFLWLFHAQGKELHIPNGKLQNCGNIFQGSAIAKEHCATEIPCFHVFLCLISCNQNLTYLCDFHMHCYSGKRSTKVMKITNKRDIIARIVVRKLLLQMSATNRSPGRWQYF
jgi:hypothetical protein